MVEECPDSVETRDEAGWLVSVERCAACRLTKLEEAMESDQGRNLRRALELMDARELLGAVVRLEELSPVDLLCARAIRDARIRKQDEAREKAELAAMTKR